MCIVSCWRRSAEGRKRIITEIVRTLNGDLEPKPLKTIPAPAAALAEIPFRQQPGSPPPHKVRTFLGRC